MDADDEKRKRHLVRKQRWVAAGAVAVFGVLIYFSGQNLKWPWNAQTVGLFADASQVALAVWVPLALLAGAIELIAVIIRIAVIRWLKQTGQFPPETKSPPPAGVKDGKSGGKSGHPRSPMLILAPVLAAISLVWVWAIVSSMRNERDLHRGLEAGANLGAAIGGGAALPRERGDHGEIEKSPCMPYPPEVGAFLCTANKQFRSADELGQAACGRGGLGYPILRQNRIERGYRFGPKRVPDQTEFIVRCVGTKVR